jgi:hypothetical protein
MLQPRRSMGRAMSTLTTYADTARFDQFFAAVIGFWADFFGGARQGGYPLFPQPALAARRR